MYRHLAKLLAKFGTHAQCPYFYIWAYVFWAKLRHFNKILQQRTSVDYHISVGHGTYFLILIFWAVFFRKMGEVGTRALKGLRPQKFNKKVGPLGGTVKSTVNSKFCFKNFRV